MRARAPRRVSSAGRRTTRSFFLGLLGRFALVLLASRLSLFAASALLLLAVLPLHLLLGSVLDVRPIWLETRPGRSTYQLDAIPFATGQHTHAGLLVGLRGGAADKTASDVKIPDVRCTNKAPEDSARHPAVMRPLGDPPPFAAEGGLEAARVAAEKWLRLHPKNTGQQLFDSFRALTGRKPSEKEVAALQQLYTDSLLRYQSDPQAATELLTKNGESPVVGGLDPTEVAAMTMVQRMLLSHQETVLKYYYGIY